MTARRVQLASGDQSPRPCAKFTRSASWRPPVCTPNPTPSGVKPRPRAPSPEGATSCLSAGMSACPVVSEVGLMLSRTSPPGARPGVPGWRGSQRSGWPPPSRHAAPVDYGPCVPFGLQYARKYVGFNPNPCNTRWPAGPAGATLAQLVSFYSSSPGPAVLRKGDVGPAVSVAQQVIKAGADGNFGPLTETAVKTFQSAHGLPADGVVAGTTWAAFARSLTGSTAKALVPRALAPAPAAPPGGGRACPGGQRGPGTAGPRLTPARSPGGVSGPTRPAGHAVQPA